MPPHFKFPRAVRKPNVGVRGPQDKILRAPLSPRLRGESRREGFPKSVLHPVRSLDAARVKMRPLKFGIRFPLLSATICG